MIPSGDLIRQIAHLYPFIPIYIHLYPFISIYIHLYPFISIYINLYPFISIYIHLSIILLHMVLFPGAETTYWLNKILMPLLKWQCMGVQAVRILMGPTLTK